VTAHVRTAKWLRDWSLKAIVSTDLMRRKRSLFIVLIFSQLQK